MSYTIFGHTNQTIDIATKTTQGAYGEGKTSVVKAGVACRFVEDGIARYDVQSKAPVVFGKAVIWMQGDIDIRKGMLVITKDAGKVFTVIDVSKRRDVTFANKVDHTRCVLE